MIRAQWSDFEELYRNDPCVESFVATFEGLKDSERAKLLRHHHPNGVSDPKEIALRDGADYLLSYFSMLEIASLIRYVEEPLPDRMRTEAIRILADPAMQKYYTELYPVQLPQLFYNRLRGNWVEHVGPQDDFSLVFWRFQGFVSRNRENLALLDLLSLLDGFWYRDQEGNFTSIKSIAEAFANPEKIFLIFLSERDQRSEGERLIDGIREFFEFAKEFDELLSQAKNPLLQAELWLYYAYYFRGKPGDSLQQSLKAASKSIQKVNSRDSDLESIRAKESFEQYWAAIQRLLGGKYGEPILGPAAAQPDGA